MFIQLGSFFPSREPDTPSALGVGPLGANSTRIGGLVASPVSHHACGGLIKTFGFRRCKGEDGGRKHWLTTGTALSQAINRFARLHKCTATRSVMRPALCSPQPGGSHPQVWARPADHRHCSVASYHFARLPKCTATRSARRLVSARRETCCTAHNLGGTTPRCGRDQAQLLPLTSFNYVK